MKNLTKALAVSVVATMALSSVFVFATTLVFNVFRYRNLPG